MGGLCQRIEGQQAGCRFDPPVDRPACHLMGQQLVERADRKLFEPPALADQPFLEHVLCERQAVEKITLVERDGPLKRLDRACANQPLEGDDVDHHAIAVERQFILPRHDDLDIGGRQLPAETT